MLKGKKVLLCVTGSIAVYKSVNLLRLLVKNGVEVRVIMTDAAKTFVTPLTFSTLSKNKVLSELSNEEGWTNHVMLGRWADVILIAPASCNTIAKIAHGFCDNLLQAVYLSATAPAFIAPAMDEDMWLHSATRKNIEILKEAGHKLINVNKGELASGLTGEGRMAEPEEILEELKKFFLVSSELEGKVALVTAGPTYEAIDPVRFIGNHSSGKMGIAIAKELQSRGAKVHLILGPSQLDVPLSIETVRVTSASQMFDAAFNYFSAADIIVMAAAVADFKPEIIADQKIKKDARQALSIKLTKTKDLLSSAGELKSKKQILVGFALETEKGNEHAMAKLSGKNADLIVLNSLEDEGAGFSHDTNKISVFARNGAVHHFEKKRKEEVAADIVEIIINLKK
ncbi:MAG: bifunctional phosphopantothenoylcysteine decarboxylase/phosphopantothenate--cysteine ligase CoaBC [Ginsengibacter sp.]